jgi:hypothetical protein
MADGTIPPSATGILNGAVTNAGSTANAAGSSGGGADPVTAIANAAGDLFDLISQITKSTGLNKKSWLKRLDESIPIFHNWDSERIDKSKDYLYVFGFLNCRYCIGYCL